MVQYSSVTSPYFTSAITAWQTVHQWNRFACSAESWLMVVPRQRRLWGSDDLSLAAHATLTATWVDQDPSRSSRCAVFTHRTQSEPSKQRQQRVKDRGGSFPHDRHLSSGCVVSVSDVIHFWLTSRKPVGGCVDIIDLSYRTRCMWIGS